MRKIILPGILELTKVNVIFEVNPIAIKNNNVASNAFMRMPCVRPYDEIFATLSKLHLHPYYDLLRIDMACFPWFADRLLQPLSQIGQGVEDLLDNFSDQIKLKYSMADGIAYAVPFDTSVQLLFYRKDLFESTILKRMYYEKTGFKLQVPKTFQQFDSIVSFFSERYEAGNSQRPMGATLTQGSAGLIAAEYATMPPVAV